MKLAQLVAQYHDLYNSLSKSALENDPLGFEADAVLKKISKCAPEDSNDVAALAMLAKHIIQEEGDPVGAVPLLHNIVHWAECGGHPIPTNVLPFLKH